MSAQIRLFRVLPVRQLNVIMPKNIFFLLSRTVPRLYPKTKCEDWVINHILRRRSYEIDISKNFRLKVSAKIFPNINQLGVVPRRYLCLGLYLSSDVLKLLRTKTKVIFIHYLGILLKISHEACCYMIRTFLALKILLWSFIRCYNINRILSGTVEI